MKINDASLLMWNAMEAHGDCGTWVSNGALQFR